MLFSTHETERCDHVPRARWKGEHLPHAQHEHHSRFWRERPNHSFSTSGTPFLASLGFTRHSISSPQSNQRQTILLKYFVRLPYHTDTVDGEGTSYIKKGFNLKILYKTHRLSNDCYGWKMRLRTRKPHRT